jgi:hypothetical protein
MASSRDVHRVIVKVTKDGELLKRISLLNTAMLRVLSGTILIRVLSADYEEGCIELLVEADNINPSIVPGEVTVRIEPWDEEQNCPLEQPAKELNA